MRGSHTIEGFLTPKKDLRHEGLRTGEAASNTSKGGRWRHWRESLPVGDGVAKREVIAPWKGEKSTKGRYGCPYAFTEFSWRGFVR
jgi:hypothetical protein